MLSSGMPYLTAFVFMALEKPLLTQGLSCHKRRWHWVKNKFKVLLKIARWIIFEIIRALLEEE